VFYDKPTGKGVEQMATYLVTGCAGFIGSKVSELLVQDGHAVIGVDNLNEAYDVRLKKWRLEQLQTHDMFSFHCIDIGDRSKLAETFEAQPDAVINLAARAGVRYSVENPWVYVDTNLTGTLNLLELCRIYNVKKFVLASTSSLYGQHNPRPFREDADTNHPLSPYAASKKAAEVMCSTYHELYGIDVTIVRYFTVYGPAGRPDMSLFRFVQWVHEERPVTLFGNGEQSRDFTYVDDIARGTIAALQPVGYEIVNLGSDEPVVLLDTLRMVEEMVGQSAAITFEPRHKADVLHTWADITKAKEMFGWQPQTHIRDGITQLVEWYEMNRSWAKDIVTNG
jgi:nucleoside-diphosphate-sugar epimerase